MYPDSVDEGYLTAKKALPVMKLSYGGAFTRLSRIQYILGPLICKGKHSCVFKIVLISIKKQLSLLIAQFKANQNCTHQSKQHLT